MNGAKNISRKIRETFRLSPGFPEGAGRIPAGGKIYVSAGYDVWTPYGEAIEMTPVSKTLGMVVGEGVGKVAAVVTGVKAVFDVSAYIYAEVQCALK